MVVFFLLLLPHWFFPFPHLTSTTPSTFSTKLQIETPDIPFVGGILKITSRVAVVSCDPDERGFVAHPRGSRSSFSWRQPDIIILPVFFEGMETARMTLSFGMMMSEYGFTESEVSDAFAYSLALPNPLRCQFLFYTRLCVGKTHKTQA